jgi:hypothetical protein
LVPPPATRPTLRLFLGTAGLVILAATFYVVVRHKRDFVDFDVYRTAGVRALAAEPLYRVEDGHYQFKYWPAFALAMAPFAELDPEVGKVVWFGLSVALLAWFVRQSVRALPARRQTTTRLLWLTALVMGKFYVKELVNGQTNALLGVMLLGALLTARRNHRVLAGTLIGAAVFVKPYALVLLPWLAVTQGVSAVLACGGVVGAGLLMPAAVYGWSGNLDLLTAWYRTVINTTAPNLLFPENISLASMWAKWIGPGTTASAMAAATSVAAIGLAIAVWFRRRAVSEPDYLEFGFLLLLVPLLSPQGWDYVLLLATPAVVCLMDRWTAVPMGWRAATGVAIGLMSVTIFDLLGRVLYGRLMMMAIVSVCAIVLAGSLAHLRWRSLA